MRSNPYTPSPLGRSLGWAGMALIAALLGLHLVGGARPAAAQEGPRLAVTPTVVEVEVESTFTVALAVAEVIDLGAFQFTMVYDPLQVEFLTVTVGSFPGLTGRKVVTAGPVTGTDRFTFGAYSEPGAPGPSGSGELALVRFRALAEGQSDLEVVDAGLSDTANNPMAIAGVTAGLVRIHPPVRSIYLPVVTSGRRE